MLTLLAAAEETQSTLPAPPIAYGIVAMSVLVFLLVVTLAFRSISHRHR